MTQAAVRTGCGPGGLRERKKIATRKALAVAAIRLAVRRGLDNVLVEDIAAAAGVSPRTFNNYFASKYEAICSLAVDRASRIADALLARPAGEPLWDAITSAVLADYGPARTAPDPQWVASWRLVARAPELRGEYLKAMAATQHAIAAAIAERTGAAQGDMFPRILAGAVVASCQAAMERWLASDPPVPLGPMIAEAMSDLASGMVATVGASERLQQAGRPC
jgi:AcrR family transcriptional regulator